ncbi:MAG: exodeoxyribonuclease VII small subunit [Bacteroidales bacterium]|nr:exodeoxyribonuclease VII small subunit [Bacteroidales bacterium]
MENFDYKNALAELEKILKEVENPETSLDSIDEYIKKADGLIRQCRNYLRSAREKLV